MAEIDDDGLLGIDVLQNGIEGPMDLLMSKGVLIIENQEVPIIQVGCKNSIRRVTAADHYVIPAQCESVIDVYVERQEYDDFSSETDNIIEPTSHFQETYPLQMAPTLVDINSGCTCKVRLLNPFPRAMSIKQDAVIGTAQPIDESPKILFPSEREGEEENFCWIRRIGLHKNDDLTCHQSASMKVGTEETSELPNHLIDLYQRATKGSDEKKTGCSKLAK